jgi:hypothetical protein
LVKNPEGWRKKDSAHGPLRAMNGELRNIKMGEYVEVRSGGSVNKKIAVSDLQQLTA